jgi:hypothetical protein
VIRRFIEWRIARHDARAKAFAAATVAAQRGGDAPAAAKFHTQMCEAQAIRDGLRELVQCCNHDCDEGRACPLRTH